MGFHSLGLSFFLLASATTGAAPRWQPVTDYTISFPGERPHAAPEINPFENFTHIGGDFGWMGPGEKRIDGQAGVLRVKTNGGWTGVWHSLSGLARENERLLDPENTLGLNGHATPIQAITIDAGGNGLLRIELTNEHKSTVWERVVTLGSADIERHRFELDPTDLGPLKFINWVVEPETEARVSAIGMEIEMPEMPPEETLFRISLGKLRKCHDPASGLTRDRAHTPPGYFDSVSATGLQALASATAAAEGVLDRETVAGEIRHTTRTILALPKAAGFLPHFTRLSAEGHPELHPGTEFSTVDTAIALIALRQAALLLELDDAAEEIAGAIAALDFDAVTDDEGWIHHGFKDDGTTLLESRWKDWGGETALVLVLEGMVPDRTARGRMDTAGAVHGGTAFIAEIQSLFFPDFDRSVPDHMTGVNWPEARRALLARQMAYPAENWPGSPATRAGLFGFSAGEAGMPGDGYTANGVDSAGLTWLHPHAMVLSLALSGEPGALADGISKLEKANLLFPFGLPENVEKSLARHNPMLGSLNAAFETLAAYHGWKRGTGSTNFIHKASKSDPMTRRGLERFYPAN